MSQSHGSSLWTEPAGSGGAPTPLAIYLVRDGGGDIVPSLTGPAAFQFVDVDGTGDYTLLDLAPVYLVSNGMGGLTTSLMGPAAGVLADDGFGGIVQTTDLTRAAIADLYHDTGGTLWTVRRTAARLGMSHVLSNIQTY